MDLSSVLGIGVGVLLLAALFAWALLSPSPPRDSTAQAMLHMERWLAVFKIASGMTVLSVVMPTRDRLWRWLFFWGFMAGLALMFAWKSRP